MCTIFLKIKGLGGCVRLVRRASNAADLASDGLMQSLQKSTISGGKLTIAVIMEEELY